MIKDDKLIILVDDDVDDREFFTYALESMGEGYTCKTMHDGPCLVDYLSHEENALPRMVFLDINMPRMKGVECLEIIRRKYSKTELPVAIYSTSIHETDKHNASVAGANLYIQKPVDIIPLKSLIRKALSYNWSDEETVAQEMVCLWKPEPM